MVEGRGSGGFTRPRRVQEIAGNPQTPAGQLYQLADDPQERKNLWETSPERVQELQKLLNQVRAGSARKAAVK